MRWVVARMHAAAHAAAHGRQPARCSAGSRSAGTGRIWAEPPDAVAETGDCIEEGVTLDAPFGSRLRGAT